MPAVTRWIVRQRRREDGRGDRDAILSRVTDPAARPAPPDSPGPTRLPALLADPAPAVGRLWLRGARLFTGADEDAGPGAAVLVTDGRIERIARAGEAPPADATVVELDGATLLPGLIDAHVHASEQLEPEVPEGGEPLLAGTHGHLVAAGLRRTLAMGITTIRDVGARGDAILEARQAIRFGAFRGPRILACGRIVSATSPGGRFFEGMYREADGPDDVRRAVREQVRRGADFIKVMTTGARSVELEDPWPAQLTLPEMTALVEEAHRLGRRVAAHCEGTPGVELALEAGVDTIEHGMYLHARPDLLDRMAATGTTLVPTLSCYYGVGPEGRESWAPHLVDLANRNLEAAGATLRAAVAAGVPIAMGFDWAPAHRAAVEVVRLVEHGMTPRAALVAATRGSARALGLADLIGTIEVGRLADLLVVDGNPLDHPEHLTEPDRIRLVLQAGTPVAGTMLERRLG